MWRQQQQQYIQPILSLGDSSCVNKVEICRLDVSTYEANIEQPSVPDGWDQQISRLNPVLLSMPIFGGGNL